ncbi:unnamed protein product [Schistosoma margrebowiei]|uniref:Uncharacterized protein n=1 Tax=Schistosoma margrebowiei TaxID=48269 RepID=A0A3P8BTU7_9TREM|nr:unnamed protein product [Schistosoma margrebowiei]
MENGKTKSSNSRSDGEVVLLTVEGCDSSKVFPSDNQHDSDAASPQGRVRWCDSKGVSLGQPASAAMLPSHKEGWG